jgi:hypothetical protein
MSENPEAEQDAAIEKAIGEALTVLHRHCDSVQVVVTVETNGEHGLFWGGRGNLYARLGSVRAWLKREERLERATEVQFPGDEEEEDRE